MPRASSTSTRPPWRPVLSWPRSPPDASSPRRARPDLQPSPRDRSRSSIPQRHTIRRSVGEPGELEAFETTAIHAKIAGYVKNWTVNIGAAVKKGQVLAELSVPELDAELKQKQAAVEQAICQAQAGRGRGQGGRGQRGGRRGEARRSPGRQEEGRGRPRPLASRVSPRRGIACCAGVDRQPARRDPEQAPLFRGRLRRECGRRSRRRKWP